MLNKHNIPIVVHLIVGLKGETKKCFLDTVQYVGSQKISGIKMAMLHILEDSPLGKEYKNNPFYLLDKDTYIEWVAEGISYLPENFVIHRLTGDGAHKNLIAPKWSGYKRSVLNGLHKYMIAKNIYQGSNCSVERLSPL